MPARRKTNTEYRQSETYLKDIESITIVFDNESTATFHPDAELKIAEHPALQRKQAIEAPAKIAFWSAQVARSLRDVRKKETQLKQIEGTVILRARAYYEDQVEVKYVSHDMIRAVLGTNAEVRSATLALNAAKDRHETLTAMHAAVEHRCFVLRKLIGTTET